MNTSTRLALLSSMNNALPCLAWAGSLENENLVCNSGSSSLKFSLFEANRELLLAEGSIDWTIRLCAKLSGCLVRKGQQKITSHRDN